MATKTVTATTRGCFHNLKFKISNLKLRWKPQPKIAETSASSTAALKKVYLPTMNGKSVEGVTNTTAKGARYKKNFDIL